MTGGEEAAVVIGGAATVPEGAAATGALTAPAGAAGSGGFLATIGGAISHVAPFIVPIATALISAVGPKLMDKLMGSKKGEGEGVSGMSPPSPMD